MPSAVIPSVHSYAALPLARQQPNPWDLLQPQDVMSRHRGAKRRRRYGLLGVISLLSPAYLLSVERWPIHAGPPDHYGRLSTLLDLSVSQSGGLMPLHSCERFPTALSPPSRASVTLWEATAPVKLPTMRCPGPGLQIAVRHPCLQGWYFKDGSTRAGARASKPTTYPTHADTNASAK